MELKILKCEQNVLLLENYVFAYFPLMKYKASPNQKQFGLNGSFFYSYYIPKIIEKAIALRY